MKRLTGLLFGFLVIGLCVVFGRTDTEVKSNHNSFYFTINTADKAIIAEFQYNDELIVNIGTIDQEYLHAGILVVEIPAQVGVMPRLYRVRTTLPEGYSRQIRPPPDSCDQNL